MRLTKYNYNFNAEVIHDGTPQSQAAKMQWYNAQKYTQGDGGNQTFGVNPSSFDPLHQTNWIFVKYIDLLFLSDMD